MVLTSSWWVFVIFLWTFIFWLILEIIVLQRFKLHLESINYPLVQKWQLFNIRARVYEHWSAQVIGITWFLRRRQLIVYLIALFIFMMSWWRAVETESALEFSRGGALIVIAGFVSLVLGYVEERLSKRIWHKIEMSPGGVQNGGCNPGVSSKIDLDEFIAFEVDRGQLAALRATVIVSIIGTLIWAYGDQFMACEIFEIYEIPKDKNTFCIGS